jgi:uncharacterized protein YdhG (YjbR/CyaY superfamily)
MTSDATVDEYLAALPDDRRAAMDELRRTIVAAAPEAVETIAYDMPALRTVAGRFLVSYAAYRRHYSVFPASAVVVAALGDDLGPYLSGKGTIRFPAGRPIPVALVARVVEVRLAEVAGSDGR